MKNLVKVEHYGNSWSSTAAPSRHWENCCRLLQPFRSSGKTGLGEYRELVFNLFFSPKSFFKARWKKSDKLPKVARKKMLKLREDMGFCSFTLHTLCYFHRPDQWESKLKNFRGKSNIEAKLTSLRKI